MSIEPVYQQLGKEIQRLRMRRGMSQDELAMAVGFTSRVQVCRVELGEQRVMLHDLVKYAKALKVGPTTLFKACL